VMDIFSKNEIIRIANCIIPRQSDKSVILSVKAVAFNDYSLPGKTIKGNVDIETFLIDSVQEKTEILISSFENKLYEIAYEKNGQLFERSVLVVDHCEGVPTTNGDREKYGIGVFRPDITFTPDWQDKNTYLLAPGIHKTLLTYYSDLPDLKEKYPNHLSLCQDEVSEMCRRFEKA
jgi:hypothetical protein